MTLTKTQIVVVAGLVIGLVFAPVTYYFAKSDEPVHSTPVVEAVAGPTTLEERNKIVDGCLDAMLRAWRITDACHDEKNNVFFYNIAAHPHEDDGSMDAGWYMMTNFKFVELQNGSYIIEQHDDGISVVPDTTGLRCKSQIKVWQKRN